MKDAGVKLRFTETEYLSVHRAKEEVIEILGGLQNPTNPKVQGVGITIHEGKPAVEVLLRDDLPVKDPVLPKTVRGYAVVFSKSSEIKSGMEKKAEVFSNRKKMLMAVNEISNKLASAFHKNVNIGWPPSFALSDKHTVVVMSHHSEDSDSYLVTVKVLGEVGSQPAYVRDITIDQQSKPEAISAFITAVKEDIQPLKETISTFI